MKPEFFLTKDNRINVRLSLKHSDYIISNFGNDIDNLNPSLAQRIKYEIIKPKNIKCICGNHLSFSSNKNEVFNKTCSSHKCIVTIRKKVKPDLKRKATYKTFSHYEIKKYLSNKIEQKVTPNYFVSKDDSESLFIRIEAKKYNMKISQYCFHIMNNLSMEKIKCSHGKDKNFNNYKAGYFEPKCCSTLAAKNKKHNSILNRLNNVTKFNVISHGPINEKPWQIQCLTCNNIMQAFVNNGKQVDNIRCQICNPLNKSTYEFQLIEEISKKYSGEIIHTFQLQNTKNKNSYKSIDIFIPEFKLGIEINGLYWHKNNKKSHLEKYLKCKELGINLIQFTDLDIDTNLDLVLSMIFNKLKLNNRIYARKCFIREISNRECKEFCDENHIKGYSAAKIKLGMFYNEKLVSILSLRKSRFNSNDIEIIRFCSIKNTNIVGGLSKFLSYINKQLNIKSLVTYADLHYGDGNGYEVVGFVFEHQTPPNYWYIANGKLESRQKYQKHNLIKMGFDKNLSEQQIMKSIDIDRYYDCGNKKFRWITRST